MQEHANSGPAFGTNENSQQSTVTGFSEKINSEQIFTDKLLHLLFIIQVVNILYESSYRFI